MDQIVIESSKIVEFEFEKTKSELKLIYEIYFLIALEHSIEIHFLI